jgi:hypothetical protein
MSSAFIALKQGLKAVSGAQAYNIVMKTGMYFSGKIKKAA